MALAVFSDVYYLSLMLEFLRLFAASVHLERRTFPECLHAKFSVSEAHNSINTHEKNNNTPLILFRNGLPEKLQEIE